MQDQSSSFTGLMTFPDTQPHNQQAVCFGLASTGCTEKVLCYWPTVCNNLPRQCFIKLDDGYQMPQHRRGYLRHLNGLWP